MIVVSMMSAGFPSIRCRVPPDLFDRVFYIYLLYREYLSIRSGIPRCRVAFCSSAVHYLEAS